MGSTCRAKAPVGLPYHCTQEKGHAGDHVAAGMYNDEYARWPDTEAAAVPNVRHRVYDALRDCKRATLDDAHDLAMAAKEAIFRAQDAVSWAWEREPQERATLRKIEKRLRKVRAELEGLDRDVLSASFGRRGAAHGAAQGGGQ